MLLRSGDGSSAASEFGVRSQENPLWVAFLGSFFTHLAISVRKTCPHAESNTHKDNTAATSLLPPKLPHFLLLFMPQALELIRSIIPQLVVQRRNPALLVQPTRPRSTPFPIQFSPRHRSIPPIHIVQQTLLHGERIEPLVVRHDRQQMSKHLPIRRHNPETCAELCRIEWRDCMSSLAPIAIVTPCSEQPFCW